MSRLLARPLAVGSILCWTCRHKTMAAVRARDAALIRHQQRSELPLMVFAPYIDPNAASFFAERDVQCATSTCAATAGSPSARSTRRSSKKQARLRRPRPSEAGGPLRIACSVRCVSRRSPCATPRAHFAARAGGGSPQKAADVLTKLKRRGVLLKTGSQLSWAPGGYQQALELWTHGFCRTEIRCRRWRERQRTPAWRARHRDYVA
jgi:hypothetical protein